MLRLCSSGITAKNTASDVAVVGSIFSRDNALRGARNRSLQSSARDPYQRTSVTPATADLKGLERL
ncbi:MAG: hypothetical protein FWF78_10310 [Defluviitaleaceae bacterium]|nr:hypothetical protein [Defluviitaleaceae bacterium]